MQVEHSSEYVLVDDRLIDDRWIQEMVQVRLVWKHALEGEDVTKREGRGGPGAVKQEDGVVLWQDVRETADWHDAVQELRRGWQG